MSVENSGNVLLMPDALAFVLQQQAPQLRQGGEFGKLGQGENDLGFGAVKVPQLIEEKLSGFTQIHRSWRLVVPLSREQADSSRARVRSVRRSFFKIARRLMIFKKAKPVASLLPGRDHHGSLGMPAAGSLWRCWHVAGLGHIRHRRPPHIQGSTDGTTDHAYPGFTASTTRPSPRGSRAEEKSAACIRQGGSVQQSPSSSCLPRSNCRHPAHLAIPGHRLRLTPRSCSPTVCQCVCTKAWPCLSRWNWSRR